MFDIFGSVRGLLSVDSVSIDNNIFRLHYKATVILLVLCSLLVTSRQYIGDPIDCIVNGVPGNVMDSYCWIHSTFTVPAAVTGTIGVDVPHAGIAPPPFGVAQAMIAQDQHSDDEIKFHKYYQWVCFMLFFQALLFFAPRYLWTMWEGGRCKMLVMDMNCPSVDEETTKSRRNLLVDYFQQNLHHHDFYAWRFFFCELLNFVNVIGQIYLTDRFLGYEFSTYGTRVVQYVQREFNDRPDPMALVFPKLTKCTFHKFGKSGTVERVDGLCVLSLNIINEKIYVFVWFWFVALAVITALAIVYRLATLLSPAVRLYVFRARATSASDQDVHTIMHKLRIGDWFVLHQLSKNMDALVFDEFVHDLAVRFDNKGSS